MKQHRYLCLLSRQSVCLLMVVCFLCVFSPAQAQSLSTEYVKIPVTTADGVYYDDARIIKPEGDGPFPLIVLNHGTPRDAAERAKTDVSTYFIRQSTYFVKQGYAVAFVVRRGFGTSTAPYKENFVDKHGKRNYTLAGLEAAKDIGAAVEFMKQQPYVDATHIVLMGQSTGGHSVVATGSLGLKGVIGIVNFAGGRGSYAPDLVRDEDKLVESMGEYGKTSRLPSIWLYAANDHYFRPELAQAMFKAYVDHGGKAEFVALPAYKDDGHGSFVGNVAVWGPYVNQFLAELKSNP